MSGGERDGEVREVISELDALLDALDANVAALKSLLLPPEADPDLEKVVQ